MVRRYRALRLTFIRMMLYTIYVLANYSACLIGGIYRENSKQDCKWQMKVVDFRQNQVSPLFS